MPDLANMVATRLKRLLSSQSAECSNEERHSSFYLILIDLSLHLNHYGWLVASLLDSIPLDIKGRLLERNRSFLFSYTSFCQHNNNQEK